MSTMPKTAWFVNEEGVAYKHDVSTQEKKYPNDHHTPFATRREAEAANVWHPFKVGDWALHKNNELDAREVAAIGWMGDEPVIDLQIGTARTGPVPADNYTNVGPR